MKPHFFSFFNDAYSTSLLVNHKVHSGNMTYHDNKLIAVRKLVMLDGLKIYGLQSKVNIDREKPGIQKNVTAKLMQV